MCRSKIPLYLSLLSLFVPPPVLFHGYGVQVHRHPERSSAGPAVEDRGAATERRTNRWAGAGARHQRWSDQAAADRAGPVPQLVPASSQLPGDSKHRYVSAVTPDSSCLWCAFITSKAHTVLQFHFPHELLGHWHKSCLLTAISCKYHRCQKIETSFHFSPLRATLSQGESLCSVWKDHYVVILVQTWAFYHIHDH